MEKKIHDPYFWYGIYKVLYNDLPLNFNKDFTSSSILNILLSDKLIASERNVRELISGKIPLVFGPVEETKDVLESLKLGRKQYVLVAVDGVVKAFHEVGLKPDIVITDLDGDLKCLKEFCTKETLYVIHAHGDNIDKILLNVPSFNCKIIGTSQVPPYGRLKFYGGFTDGDRALYFLSYYNPSKIIVIGMDFTLRKLGKYSKPLPDGKLTRIKMKKLIWGKFFIELLSKNLGNIYGYKVQGLDIPKLQVL